MDIKEKRKKYYIDNRDRIIERNKQYYYNNIEERKNIIMNICLYMVINMLKKEAMITSINQNIINIIENTGKDINIYIRIIFFMLRHLMILLLDLINLSFCNT